MDSVAVPARRPFEAPLADLHAALVARRLKPIYRVAPERRCYATARADRGCQPRTRVRRRRIASIVCGPLSRAKLEQGVPFEKVIDSNAPGSLTIRDEYQRLYDVRLSPTTIVNDLQAVFGQPTGRLGARHSDLAGKEVQANTYSVRHVHRTLGSKGSKLARELANYAFSLGQRAGAGQAHGARCLIPISVQRALEVALERAVEGNRHRCGLELAWHLAHRGQRPCVAKVPKEVAMAVLRDYQQTVKSLGGRKYEWREARKAVESAYRKTSKCWTRGTGMTRPTLREGHR